MSKGDLFIAGVVVLQLAAGASYAWDREWRQCGVWVFGALSNVAYLSLVRG